MKYLIILKTNIDNKIKSLIDLRDKLRKGAIREIQFSEEWDKIILYFNNKDYGTN